MRLECQWVELFTYKDGVNTASEKPSEKGKFTILHIGVGYSFNCAQKVLHSFYFCLNFHSAFRNEKKFHTHNCNLPKLIVSVTRTQAFYHKFFVTVLLII